MITPADIQERLRQTPFKPFAFVTADGNRYKVRHPGQAWVAFTTVFVAVPAEERRLGGQLIPYFFNQGIVEQLSVSQITRLKVLRVRKQPKEEEQ